VEKKISLLDFFLPSRILSYTKIGTNEQETSSLLRCFLQRVQAVFAVYRKDRNKRAKYKACFSILKRVQYILEAYLKDTNIFKKI